MLELTFEGWNQPYSAEIMMSLYDPVYLIVFGDPYIVVLDSLPISKANRNIIDNSG